MMFIMVLLTILVIFSCITEFVTFDYGTKLKDDDILHIAVAVFVVGCLLTVIVGLGFLGVILK